MFNSGKLQKKFSRKGIFMVKFISVHENTAIGKPGKGLTLAELLIVVAIIAVRSYLHSHFHLSAPQGQSRY